MSPEPPPNPDTDLLVALALLSQDPADLQRAAAVAVTSRDRQLVALAEASLAGDTDRLDVLARDHLADHPGHLMATWIARHPHTSTQP